MMGLPCGEEIMVVGRTMWTQSTSVTDRRTDRITITDTVQTASHGKNCITIILLKLLMDFHVFILFSPAFAIFCNGYGHY